jgi:nucleotide-binding universal stress UspA family protein
MTRVLIAADDSDLAVETATHAHRLFGDDAVYFVIHVADAMPIPTMAWGYAYPVAMPMVAYPPPTAGTGTADPTLGEGSARDVAEQRAAHVVDDAALGTSARPLADVGDPATAIVDAARDQHVDVIVVGSHERSWFSRLFSGSVVQDVVREAPVPVLVVK